MEKSWEQNIDVPNLFIDFQAAYDTIWRKEIWSEMHELSFSPQKLAKLSTIINNEIYVKFKICKHVSSELKVYKFLRQ